jgi:hypothetical protein
VRSAMIPDTVSGTAQPCPVFFAAGFA